MAQFPSLTLTEAGIEMIAASQGGSELIFTRMKMGDGDSTGVEVMELVDLIAPKISIDISSIDTATVPGQITLTATVSNIDLEAGFFTKELGIFAKIEETGTEKLYAYTNAGSYADYMPSKATPIDENTIRATMVVANNERTTAIINSSVVFVTAGEVDAKIKTHNDNTGAHPEGLTCPLIDWTSGSTYKVNDVRVYDDKIWRCKTKNSDVDFDKTKWANIGGGGGGRYLGEILWLSAEDAEGVEGILKADHAEVSRTMYPDLNALYASQNYPWGAGDGSTTFNLPNLIGKFAEGADVAGGYHSAGLPNITGDFRLPQAVDGTGAFTTFGTGYVASTTANVYNNHVSIDASKSNSIYGNSNTVQPNSALLIPYVVVFTDATADSALVDMTQYDQDLANKANRSLTNLTQEANDKLKAMAFPSDTIVVVSSMPYTAPANGWLRVESSSNSNPPYSLLSVNGTRLLRLVGGGNYGAIGYIPVKKGDVISYTAESASFSRAEFYFAEGEV